MFKNLIVLVVVIVVCAGSPLMAQAPAARPSAPTAVAADPEMALFAVPDLDKAKAVRKISRTLSGKPGILGAKVDRAKGVFKVTFEPGKTNPQEILKQIVAVAPGATFQAVTAPDGKPAAKGACGACPNRAKCGGAK